MPSLLFFVALAVMLIGLVGTVVPVLPGLPLVIVGPFLYALPTGFGAGVGVGHLVAFTVLGSTAITVSLLARAAGTRVAGGTRAGTVGAIFGLLIGLFFPPVGLLAGPFVGAFTFELAAVRQVRLALRSGVGATLGVLASTAIEAAVALGITAAFAFAVITAG